jgi:hypothetical protein
MRIKKFKESISGWELVGKDMGPNYPEQKLPVTLTKDDTSVLMGIDDKFYTENDFLDLYNLYLKSGGKENLSEFTKANLDKILNLFI